MKKSLLVLGVAVAALASCTNEEVVSMPEGHAIGFNSFVNNNTKAVTEVTSLSSDQFYVFGRFSSDGSQWSSENLFNNELASKNYYWVQGNQYRFGAYANGQGEDLTDVSFDPSTQTLTFSDYTPNDAKDLLAATGTADASSNIPSDPVSLSFSHMLAQVAFTFNTEDGDEYEIEISEISIQKAINTATGTYLQPAHMSIPLVLLLLRGMVLLKLLLLILILILKILPMDKTTRSLSWLSRNPFLLMLLKYKLSSLLLLKVGD